MGELKDSGERRKFESGAVRDITDNKGRCDLLPLDILGVYFGSDGNLNEVFTLIGLYIRKGQVMYLYSALDYFNDCNWKNRQTMFLEVAKHYQDGAEKYVERNWEKGIPVHCFIDSAVRHYLKFLRGDSDESHDRAFVWNILGAIWTHRNKPELIDLPFMDKVSDEDMVKADKYMSRVYSSASNKTIMERLNIEKENNHE